MGNVEEKSFGELLGEFRINARLSQQKLADKLNVSRATIVNWEKGNHLPKARAVVLELANHLGLSDGKREMLLRAALLDVAAAIWYVPYHRNPLFTGWEGILRELHHALIPGTTAAVTQSRAISGLGGIGKTQTALEYAYRYRDDYSAVLWLQADSRQILFLSSIQLAQELGLVEREDTDQTQIVAVVKRWLKSKTRWLLVLDNVEDPMMIEEFLPPGHHGCVLLTTRAQGVTEHIALIHALEILPEKEGILLLLRRSGLLAFGAPPEQADLVDCTHAKILWELVEGLPLALDQIGAYVRATGCSLDHYRSLYMEQQRRLDLLKIRGQAPPGHKESVATTFSVAFNKIQTMNPAAAEMLQVCALLHPKNIPEEIITKGGEQLGVQLSSLVADPLLFDQAVDVLQTYSMVQRDAQKRMLSIHRLVQAILQDSMPEPEQEEWTKRAVAAMDVVFSAMEKTTWEQEGRFLPHVLDCVKRTQSQKSFSTHLASLLMKIADNRVYKGAYLDAKPLYQQALHVWEQIYGRDHPQVAYTLHELAELHRYLHWYSEAEPAYQQALEIWKRLSMCNHPNAGYSLIGLAHLYTYQSEHTKKARPLYLQAIRNWKQAWGPDDPRMTIPLNGLAHLYDQQKKYLRAERLYQQALHIWEQASGLSSPDVAEQLIKQAHFYGRRGRYEEAEPLYQRALRIWEQTREPDHFVLTTPLNSLADLYTMQQRYEEAEPLYQRSLRIQEQTFGSKSVDAATQLDKLAPFYVMQHKYEEAESLYKRSLHIQEQRQGPNHSSVAEILSNLALLYTIQHKYEEAELHYKRSLQIYSDMEWLWTSHAVYPINGLVYLYTQQDKYIEAKNLYQHVLTILEQTSHPYYPEEVEERKHYYDTCLQNLGVRDIDVLFQVSPCEWRLISPEPWLRRT